MYVYGESICIPFLPYFQILCWWPDEGRKWPTHASGRHSKWIVCEQLKIGVMDWLVLCMTCKYMVFIRRLKTGWIWEGQAHVLSNLEPWKCVQNHILACASFLVTHTASFNKLYVWFTLCADVPLSQYLWLCCCSLRLCVCLTYMSYQIVCNYILPLLVFIYLWIYFFTSQHQLCRLWPSYFVWDWWTRHISNRGVCYV